MKVKCIGGPNDGEWYDVPDNYRLNDQIKIPQKIKYEISDYMPVPLFEYLIKTYTNEDELVLDNTAGSGTTASYEEIRDLITVKLELYILKELRYNRNGITEKFQYLIPSSQDEWECLKAQLEK